MFDAYRWKWPIAFFCLLCLCACDKEEPIPAFIRIQSIDVETRPGEGTDDHRITDAWVFTDREFLGAFPLPGRVPVLPTGDVTLTVFSGIRKNGTTGLPTIYPFYQRITLDRNLMPHESDTLLLTTQYETATVFAILENFNDEHEFLIDRDNNNETGVQITSDPAFEGGGSGLIELSYENPVIEVAHTKVLADLPVNLSPIYLEINYMTQIPFQIGFFGERNGTPQVIYDATVFPKDEWNKIYFDFTQTVALTNFDFYHLTLRAITEQPEGSAEVDSILLDNIKLLHF